MKGFPIITKADIKKEYNCNDDYAYTKLNRLYKQNKIKKIVKGKYTQIDNIYVISSNLYTPSYISFWTASSLKGYTEQIVNTIHVVTTKNHNEIIFENYKICFHKFSKSTFFGYQKERVGNFFQFIVDDEKLIIDCLLFQRFIGNFDELIKILKKSILSKNKIITYLKKINNISLNKRVGFLFEKFKGIDLSNELNINDKNYIDLSFFKKGVKIDSKWRLKHDFN
ncbi:MAG: type IV toxin-antitoxin system AbiEi family antitoxin domain-containing protein [Nanoarchaeota archaeon]